MAEVDYADEVCSVLQGQHIHGLLAAGRTFHGALVVIALVDSGEPRRAVELPQQLCLQALAAVRAVHKRGLQRCNPKLHILLYRPGRTLFCDNVNPAHLAPHSSILSTEPNLASCLLCTSAVI